MKRILCVLLFVFGLLTSAWADSSRYASESVLNSGKWVKIQVAEDGIYKLTAADLKKMGFSNLDKVAVYGYGGWPLDEDFSTTYIDDVPEVAVWRSADYLLFMGKGRANGNILLLIIPLSTPTTPIPITDIIS